MRGQAACGPAHVAAWRRPPLLVLKSRSLQRGVAEETHRCGFNRAAAWGFVHRLPAPSGRATASKLDSSAAYAEAAAALDEVSEVRTKCLHSRRMVVAPPSKGH